MSAEPAAVLLARVAVELGARLDGLYRHVEVVRQRVEDIGERAADRQRGPDRAALAALRPLLHELLAVDEPLVEGLGVAVGAGTLTDAPRWLEWWRKDAAGGSSFVRHVLDPDAVGFYDYQSRQWFRLPIEQDRPVAVGPYMDFGGMDSCIVTLTVPQRWASGGTSVIGADLSVPELEALLLRSLTTRELPVVLVAPNDRVIVSNTSRHVTGSRLRPSAAADGVVVVDVTTTDQAPVPWRLLAFPGGTWRR